MLCCLGDNGYFSWRVIDMKTVCGECGSKRKLKTVRVYSSHLSKLPIISKMCKRCINENPRILMTMHNYWILLNGEYKWERLNKRII